MAEPEEEGIGVVEDWLGWRPGPPGGVGPPNGSPGLFTGGRGGGGGAEEEEVEGTGAEEIGAEEEGAPALELLVWLLVTFLFDVPVLPLLLLLLFLV